MQTFTVSQLRLSEIKALAVETFGTELKAPNWLASTNLALGEPIPRPNQNYVLLTQSTYHQYASMKHKIMKRILVAIILET